MKSVGDLVDESENAYDAIAGQAAVLSRLFELMAETQPVDSAVCVDFAGRREEHFWRGLSHMARKIERSADVMHGTTDVLRKIDGAK